MTYKKDTGLEYSWKTSQLGTCVCPSKKVPRKNPDVFRGASLGVFRAFFENEKRSKTLKDAQKREK